MPSKLGKETKSKNSSTGKYLLKIAFKLNKDANVIYQCVIWCNYFFETCINARNSRMKLLLVIGDKTPGIGDRAKSVYRHLCFGWSEL